MASKGPRRPAWAYFTASDGAAPRALSYPVTPSNSVAVDGDGYMSNDELSQFEPSLRGIMCTGGDGTVSVVLHGDDETDASKRSPLKLTVGVVMRDLAIRNVFATGTGGTGIVGYR